MNAAAAKPGLHKEQSLRRDPAVRQLQAAARTCPPGRKLPAGKGDAELVQNGLFLSLPGSDLNPFWFSLPKLQISVPGGYPRPAVASVVEVIHCGF